MRKFANDQHLTHICKQYLFPGRFNEIDFIFKGGPPLFLECVQKMRFSGHIWQNFKCLYLCEFWRYEYIVNIKKMQFFILYPLARAKISRAHLRARPVRVQHHVLWKVAKIDICMVSGMARSARGSARAPIKIWKSYSSIKIDTFTLFDHCHNFKTRRNTTLRSLMENENFQILKFLIFKIFENFQKLHFHENSQKLKCVQMFSSLGVLKIPIHCKYKNDAVNIKKI